MKGSIARLAVGAGALRSEYRYVRRRRREEVGSYCEGRGARYCASDTDDTVL